MRQIETHRLSTDLIAPQSLNDLLLIEPADDAEKNFGMAHNRYNIMIRHSPTGEWSEHTKIFFQRGATKRENPDGSFSDVVPNGITNEALLAILIDRLECFQKGKFACVDNEVALKSLKEAMTALHARTTERIAREVEGLLVK